jgi:hypothetical protein
MAGSSGPNSITEGSSATTITVTGTGFVNTSTVDFDGTPLATTFVDPTKLTAVIPAADLSTAGTGRITVVSPTPGGGTSTALTFTINNPAPTLGGSGQTSATAGSPATTITVTGTGFVSTSTVDFNGTPLATTFVSPTELTAVIPAADLSTAGTDSITVVSPAPGGGTSTPQTFTISAPALALPPLFSGKQFLRVQASHGEVNLSGNVAVGGVIPKGQLTITITGLGLTHPLVLTAPIDSRGNFTVQIPMATLENALNKAGALARFGAGAKVYTAQIAFKGDANFHASVGAQHIVITYIAQPVYPHGHAGHAGQATLVGVQIEDSLGANVSAPQLSIHAVALVGPTQLHYGPSRLKQDPQEMFTFVLGQHQYQLAIDTTGLAPGDYVLGFRVAGDETIHTLTFSIV